MSARRVGPYLAYSVGEARPDRTVLQTTTVTSTPRTGSLCAAQVGSPRIKLVLVNNNNNNNNNIISIDVGLSL